MYNTITQAGDPRIEEYNANAALKPGHLLEKMSTGKVRKHATAGNPAEVLIALEDENQGKGLKTGSTWNEYAADDPVKCGYFKSGDLFVGILANGESVAIGDRLESAGGGELRKVVADTSALTIKLDSVIGFAEAACDMSDSSGVDVAGGQVLVRVR